MRCSPWELYPQNKPAAYTVVYWHLRRSYLPVNCFLVIYCLYNEEANFHLYCYLVLRVAQSCPSCGSLKERPDAAHRPTRLIGALSRTAPGSSECQEEMRACELWSDGKSPAVALKVLVSNTCMLCFLLVGKHEIRNALLYCFIGHLCLLLQSVVKVNKRIWIMIQKIR